MSKNAKCKSGLTGTEARLRENYEDFGEFEGYSETYGIANRLGYGSAQEAWDDNPMIRSSVNPSDLERISPRIFAIQPDMPGFPIRLCRTWSRLPMSLIKASGDFETVFEDQSPERVMEESKRRFGVGQPVAV